jgi:menaquinone-9 beta-reductase
MNANTVQPQQGSQIIIVGAGPAGAAAAYYLAKAKHQVLLLDRQTFPREKVCGDFVGPAAIKELQDIGVTEQPEFKKTNIINRAAVFLDEKELISQPMPQTPGLQKNGRVIPRKKLDNWILKAAKQAGATVLENVLVTGFQVEKDAVKVFAKDSKGSRVFSGSLLIGADGTNSLVATVLRGHLIPKENRIIGVRGYFENVAGPVDQADLHFASASFPGYCWLFPTGENQANVGVGVLLETLPKGNQPKELFHQLISQDQILKSRLKGASFRGNLEAWPLSTYDPNMPLVSDRVMLVGEAAGLVNPINGEGIQYALQSGRWAAETASACIENGDFSQNSLSPYSTRVSEELGYGFKISALIIQLIRNRNLNPLWLRTFEAMVARAKSDPEYANVAGSILAGLVMPSEGLTPQFLLGTLQEAAFSNTIKIVDETLSDPASLPKSVFMFGEAGFEVGVSLVENPFGFLLWGLDAAVKAADLAVSVPGQMVRDGVRVVENH